ncbi:hypothetical protein GGR20_003082 [Devosia subaequoris]|uniref:Uncharacterized protein n=1 Tax=Devosia subaequoris TaxID=395930 RepID=A0A7W6IQH1_9HYPH|nr:hypothetical protein [Devosia subaequoris]MBB4053422.1 hypothetical protein [Devosia subaequoris]MCP1210799.1 hypothetical protein [Devosia subaequoris]
MTKTMMVVVMRTFPKKRAICFIAVLPRSDPAFLLETLPEPATGETRYEKQFTENCTDFSGTDFDRHSGTKNVQFDTFFARSDRRDGSETDTIALHPHRARI